MFRRSLISLSLIFAAAATYTSCETEKITYEGPWFVRFTETALTKKESFSKPIEVEVHLAGPAQSDDLTINYLIEGSARQGVDYTIEGTPGVVEIESGEYFGKIIIHLINNSNNILRSQDLKLTLFTINAKGIEVGQPGGAMGNTYTLTIMDDCILGGNYYGIKTLADVPITDITVTSSNCEEYILSNFDIYIDDFDFPDIRDLVFIDNADNTLTIPPQEESTLEENLATIDGTGIVDPTTRVLTFSIRLVDFPGQPVHTIKLIPD